MSDEWVDADVLAMRVFAHYRRCWITGAEVNADAVEAVPGYAYIGTVEREGPDCRAFDPNPDRCWRCDALPATNDLGLCDPCHASLT